MEYKGFGHGGKANPWIFQHSPCLRALSPKIPFKGARLAAMKRLGSYSAIATRPEFLHQLLLCGLVWPLLAISLALKGEINPRYEPSVTRISCTLAPLWLETAFKIALSVPTNSRS